MFSFLNTDLVDMGSGGVDETSLSGGGKKVNTTDISDLVFINIIFALVLISICLKMSGYLLCVCLTKYKTCF